jgi:cohesin loading factor subunit SCC2
VLSNSSLLSSRLHIIDGVCSSSMEGQRAFQIVIPSQQTVNRSPRPLSVQEALRYTPLTTSPLPASDVLPIPQLSTRHANGSLLTHAERKSVALLESNRHVKQEAAQSWLRADDLPEYVFKRRPSQANQPTRPPKLSPLAKALYESTQVEYTFSEPGPNIPTANKKASIINGAVLARAPLPPIAAPPRSSQLSVEIVNPPGLRREDYAAVPDSPKRRKLLDEGRDAEVALRLRTRKEQGDTAVTKFTDVLADVFEAEARIDLVSGTIPEGVDTFHPLDPDEDFAIRLTTSTLESLQSLLKKLLTLGRLSDIPSKDLLHLQSLCSPAIQHSASLPLTLPSSPSEDEESEWLQRLVKVENGLSSALTFMSTCLGPTDQDQEFQGDLDLLRSIPTLLKNVYDNVLVPAVKARPDEHNGGHFDFAVRHSDFLRALLDLSRKYLDSLSSVCVQLSAAKDCVGETQFLASSLIFTQNAVQDKSAALGSQAYERVRKQAMSSLARIYAAFPGEREPILNSILSSVNELPSTSRGARQYKLPDGKSIMLLSALCVQLVQTASLENPRSKTCQVSRSRKRPDIDSAEDEDEEMEVERDDSVNGAATGDDEKTQLAARATTLFQLAGKNAKDIATYLISKASGVGKSADSPFRNILDLFVDDLINLLHLPDWPAAELLLRLLANKMVTMARNEKAAGVKNMALETLGAMGSAISTSRAAVQTLSSRLTRESLHEHQSTIAALVRMTEEYFASGQLGGLTLMGMGGPLAIVSQYYQASTTQSLRAKSARSFHLTQFAFMLSHLCDQISDENEKLLLTQVTADIAEQLATIDTEKESSNATVALLPGEADLAYLITILNLGFCRGYEAIVRTLLSSLSSDQAQVRSRSLKSVVAILETDPSLLDRDPSIADDVFKCASDESAMVRDASLSLIAKFIISRKNLEEKGIKRLLDCASDSKVGVQKRALGHLGDLYAQDRRPKLKAAIAQTFLTRTADIEESVSEVAKKALADAWIAPHLRLMTESADSAKCQVAMNTLCQHIVDTLEHDVVALPRLLTSYLKGLLKTAKSSTNLLKLLDRLVETLFQAIIAGEASSSSLLALTALAEARPESVAPQQLSHLRTYLKSPTTDDLSMFKSVIAVFRHVLPGLSVSHESMLKDIQNDLMLSINKLARRVDLDEVMVCLRTIDNVLHNNFRFAKLLTSVLNGILSPATQDNTKLRLMRIAGSMGKHVDVDRLTLSPVPSGYRGGSVSTFIAEVIYTHGISCRNSVLELVALESLGAVCQSWPTEFNKRHFNALFRSALDPSASGNELINKEKSQLVVLKVFSELFAELTVSKDDEDTDKTSVSEIQDLKNMGGSARKQDDQNAIAAIADAIKVPLVAAALQEPGEPAAVAIRTLSSLANCGMYHPKDYAGAFIALETSEDPDIRLIATKSHETAHQHHESHYEREYMPAIMQAFAYQKRHYEQPVAVLEGRAKLGACFSIVNTSGSKYVKKFLSNLVSRMSTDYPKVDVSKIVPDHVYFVRWIAQNLAYFEFARADDLLHVILQLELLFSKNGAEVSQAIELNLDLPSDQYGAHSGADGHLANGSEHGEQAQHASLPKITGVADPDLLKRLAAAACAITILAETKSYLKKLYGISHDVRASMQSTKQSKESAKPPTKVYGISGDRLLTSTSSVLHSLQSEQAMLARCKDFHELMSVDEDVRVADGEDPYRESYSAGPDLDGVQPMSKGRKRKQSESIGGTPKKPRGRPRKNPVNGSRRSSSTSSREDPDADYFG